MTRAINADDRARDPGHASDEELITRFRLTADGAAFESLVHRYEAELFGYLRRCLGSVELAEDVFQATFLQVYLKCDRFDDARRFRPWLYAIATNKAIDAQRRNRRHRMASLDRRMGCDDGDAAFADTLAGEEQVCDARMEAEEARAWASSAIAGLPEQLRAVLVLVYQRGLKYREAADALGIPLGTVKSRLHKAIHRLHEGWRHDHVAPGAGAVGAVTV
jgi:RNA polymerase sigma-70 factor (ECF subfamily)